MSHTVPGLEAHLQLIEAAIQADLILVQLGYTVAEAVKTNFRTMLNHWVRQGGMNLRNPVATAPWPGPYFRRGQINFWGAYAPHMLPKKKGAFT